MAKTKPRATEAKTNNLIVVSDTHFGCRLGLCPPEPVRLDDGGSYSASEQQKKVWAFWRFFWDEWVPIATRGEPFDLLHNGDVIDGEHHGSTTQISHNILDQVEMAVSAMQPAVNQCKASGGTYYHVRGTEAHVGKSAGYEEQVAKRLGARPDEDGKYARWFIWKHVGDALVHALHHIGTTGSAAYESSAPQSEKIAMYVEAAETGERPPDFVVRSHRHRFIAVDKPTYRGNSAVIVTPGWQLRTPFAYKVSGARIMEPQFGGILIRHGEERFYHLSKVWRLARGKAE